MGLKFLNKKGWHTGSLRNIETVWKAEQKNEAENRKLEELRKQIHEEREKDEFRLLQEQAGLTPRQERLEFLYDSGLAVGKTISEGFKELETHPSEKGPAPSASAPSSSSQQSAVPGALFEEKPQSANDAWRKLHSDPLLVIRQRERDAMARIQNNPVKMAMIRQSIETKKKDDEVRDEERQKKKLKQKRHSSSKHHTELEDDSHVGEENRKKEKRKKKERVDIDEESRDRARHHRQSRRDSESEEQRNSNTLRQKADRNEDDSREERTRYHRHAHNDRDDEKQRQSSPLRQKANRNEEDSSGERTRYHKHDRDDEKHWQSSPSRQKTNRDEDDSPGERTRYHKHDRDDEKQWQSSPLRQKTNRNEDDSRGERTRHHHRHPHSDPESEKRRHGSPSREKADIRENLEGSKRSYDKSLKNENHDNSSLPPRPESHKRKGKAGKLSEEERAAKLREMEMDAEIHEEQRWKRLKKAEEDDAREDRRSTSGSRGTSFINDMHKSVYGAEKGGSSTIEESLRRRTHFRQGRSEAEESNAFRR